MEGRSPAISVSGGVDGGDGGGRGLGACDGVGNGGDGSSSDGDAGPQATRRPVALAVAAGVGGSAPPPPASFDTTIASRVAGGVDPVLTTISLECTGGEAPPEFVKLHHYSDTQAWDLAV